MNIEILNCPGPHGKWTREEGRGMEEVNQLEL
jgi:hypothetical protein